MGMRLDSAAGFRHVVFYRLAFESQVEPGLIYRFRCDREGRVDKDLRPKTEVAYRECAAGKDWFPPYIEEVVRPEYHHGYGYCHCGEFLELLAPVTSCPCGERYDFLGNSIRDTVSRLPGEVAYDYERVDLRRYLCTRCSEVWETAKPVEACPNCASEFVPPTPEIGG